MVVNIKNCNRGNITDTCAILNILASRLFYARLKDAQFDLSITRFVEYECLYKPIKTITAKQKELQTRIEYLKQKGKLMVHRLTIADLQDEVLVEHGARFGIGELSCIAFCKKINQHFLTDDQGARKIGAIALGVDRVQTTPQLLGWLFYHGHVSDGDLQSIIDEHNSFGRPLEKYFKEIYQHALMLRSMG